MGKRGVIEERTCFVDTEGEIHDTLQKAEKAQSRIDLRRTWNDSADYNGNMEFTDAMDWIAENHEIIKEYLRK